MTNNTNATSSQNAPLLNQCQQASVVSLVCRICYDSEKDEDLIAPCKCKGTVAFVHRSCLETWLGESNTTTCELCHQVFNTERTPRYCSAVSVCFWCWRANGTSQEVRSDILACTIITPLTIIITYVCLFSSEYYNQVKFSSIPAARWTSVSLLVMIGIMMIGYYMWVYSAIRMHARRWYNWWQRTCNVRYIPPDPVRVELMKTTSLEIINERENRSKSTIRLTVVESNAVDMITIHQEKNSVDASADKSIYSDDTV